MTLTFFVWTIIDISVLHSLYIKLLNYHNLNYFIASIFLPNTEIFDLNAFICKELYWNIYLCFLNLYYISTAWKCQMPGQFFGLFRQRFGSIWIRRKKLAENRLTSYINKVKRGKELKFWKNEQHQCTDYKLLYRSVYTRTQ